MRKAAKKLTLCRETLLRLEAEHLKAAVAAGPTYTCYTWYCNSGTNCDLSVCICP